MTSSPELPDDASRMDKTVARRFGSAAEADAADRAHYASLTLQERVNILLQIVRPAQDACPEGFQRVSRIVKLGER